MEGGGLSNFSTVDRMLGFSDSLERYLSNDVFKSNISFKFVWNYEPFPLLVIICRDSRIPSSILLCNYTILKHTQPSLWAPSSSECRPSSGSWQVETIFRNYWPTDAINTWPHQGKPSTVQQCTPSHTHTHTHRRLGRQLRDCMELTTSSLWEQLVCWLTLNWK